MLDKSFVKKNFQKSLGTYNQSAYVQKAMAKKLISLIDTKKYNCILEIGSYTGILTREINNHFSYNNYLAIDIVDSYNYIKNISQKINFLNIDVENFVSEKKFDLIISNAAMQWCNDFNGTIKKLKSYLNNDGILAISIFAPDNLSEIKKTFNIGLNYPNIDEIEKIFSKDAKITNELITLNFDSSIELLRHLKFTGVNSIVKNNLSYSNIKKNLEILEKKYNNKLTYSPVYIID